MCKRSANTLYNVVLLKVCIYAFIIKKDKALLVENVELKVDGTSFFLFRIETSPGLPSTNCMYRTET